MVKSQIFRGKWLNTISLFGNGIDIRDALADYSKNGQLRESVEFGPLSSQDMPPPIKKVYEVYGNIYSPEPCNLYIMQFSILPKDVTNVRCYGTSFDLTFKLIKDFAKSLKLKPLDLPDDVIEVANRAHENMENLLASIPATTPEGKKEMFGKIMRGNQYMRFKRQLGLN